MKRITALLLLIAFTALCLGGCYGYNELGELGIVVVTGIDLVEKGSYQITVMAVFPVGSGLQQSEKTSVWIGSASGKSLMEATKNLRKFASKKLSWVQNDIVIIGEEAARAGLTDIVDFIVRNREIRLRNHLMVSSGQAKDIMEVPADIEKSLYSEMKGLISNTNEWSKAYVPTLLDFFKTFTYQDTGSVAGRIGYVKRSGRTFSTYKERTMQHESEGEGEKLSFLSGSAVFHECSLKGFLNDDETRGYLWIVNKAKIGAVVVDELDGEGNLSMETTGVESSIKPVVTKDGITMEVKLRVKGRIVENTSMEDLMDPDVIKRIEKAFAEIIVKEMKAAVKKAQKEYKADIFGFGDAIYRKEPGTWRQIGKDWPEMYPDIRVKYDAQVKLVRIGVIRNSIKISQ